MTTRWRKWNRLRRRKARGRQHVVRWFTVRLYDANGGLVHQSRSKRATLTLPSPCESWGTIIYSPVEAIRIDLTIEGNA